MSIYLTHTSFFIFFAACTLLSAQELRFQHYNYQDGLSHYRIPNVANILQDQQGFIWIPTFNGLNRFDGRNFKVFLHDRLNVKSPSVNQITGVCEDDEGKIWLPLVYQGLDIFDPKTNTFEKPPKNICTEVVFYIEKDKSGDIWLFGRGAEKQVCRCKKGTRDFERLMPELKYNVLTFLEDKNGTKWLGTTRGLVRYREADDSFQIFQPVPEQPSSYEWNRIWDMVEAPSGEIWITTSEKGQFIFNPQKEEFRDFPSSLSGISEKTPRDLFFDKDNILWMCYPSKILNYNLETGKINISEHRPDVETSTMAANPIFLYQDQAASLWVPTMMKGLSVTHKLENPFFDLPDNLDYLDEIISLDDRHILLGSKDGILTYDIHKKAVVSSALPPNLANTPVSWLRLSKDKKLWGLDLNQGKIFYFDLKTGKKKLINIRRKFELDSKGNCWFAGSFNYFDLKKDSLLSFENLIRQVDSNEVIKKNNLTRITIDTKDNIWIGTQKSRLIRLDPQTKKVQIFKHQPNQINSMAKGGIIKFFTGSNDWIYCRTSTGLCIYQPERDTFVHFGENDGMRSTHFIDAVEDSYGHVWLATAKGLSKLTIPDLTLQNFDESDGLPAGHFLFGHGRDSLGNIYLKKNNRFFRFHPDSIKTNTYVRPVVFTDLIVNNEVVEVGDDTELLQQQINFQKDLSLNFEQRNFGFEFVSPNFYKADKIKYFYQLENYHQDWINNGNQLIAQFTNIPEGNYIFKVKAQTEAGIWTPGISKINISVLPPWWRTWWAYLMYVVTITSILYIIYKFRLRQKLAQAESRRLAEMDILKTQLYTNITHEFRTPLTVIQGMANQIEKAPKDAKQLIHRNSQHLLHLVNQLMDISKIEAGKMEISLIQSNIIAYLNYLLQSLTSLASSKQIQLIFHSELEELVMDFDPEKLQQIIINLLSNAIKFSDHGKKVVLKASLSPTTSNGQDAFLQIEAIDQGVGIAESQLPHIFDRFYQADNSLTRQAEGTGIGLALTKELVQLMGGKISAKSRLGEGTTFVLYLPIRRTAAQATKADLAESIHEEQPMEAIMAAKKEHISVARAGNKPLLLIIEDNPDIVSYIQICLDGLYQIRVANNGQIGIDLAFELIPDIIISDIMMPEKDGYEVTQVLKNDERSSHIPIILLTAKVDMDSKVEGLQRGTDAYLTKPFHKEELLVRLQKLIELRQKMQARYASFQVQPPTEDVILQVEDAFITKIKGIIEKNMDNTAFSVGDLSQIAGMSQSQLYRKIKALTNLSLVQFIRTYRLQKAKTLLENADLNVTEVAYEVGFSDPLYFSRTFSKEFGFPPSELNKK